MSSSSRCLNNLRTQSGQMVTEAILIMVMLFAFTALVASFFKGEELFRQLITGPWRNLSGMMQNGQWADPAAGAISHPNAHGRHSTIEGEEAR